MDRFSYLSNNSYDGSVIANKVASATSNLSSGPAKDIIQASLYGDGMNYRATVRGSNQLAKTMMAEGRQTREAIYTTGANTVDAVNETGANTVDAVNETGGNIVMSQVFGSLLTSGTIAISTMFVLNKMNKISPGIDRLGANFTEGMSLLSSKMDIQNNYLSDVKEELTKIHETLKSPNITQANEWRDTGLNRLSEELWPESIGAFEKAIEYSETDPLSNLMLGKLYLDAIDEEENYHDIDKAVQYFKKAYRYANASIGKAPNLKDTLADALYLLSTSLIAKGAMDKNSDNTGDDHNSSLVESLSYIKKLLQFDSNHMNATQSYVNQHCLQTSYIP